MKNAETINIKGFILKKDGEGTWTAKNRKNLILHVWKLGDGGCASLMTADEHLYIFDLTRYHFDNIWEAIQGSLESESVKECIRIAQK